MTSAPSFGFQALLDRILNLERWRAEVSSPTAGQYSGTSQRLNTTISYLANMANSWQANSGSGSVSAPAAGWSSNAPLVQNVVSASGQIEVLISASVNIGKGFITYSVDGVQARQPYSGVGAAIYGLILADGGTTMGTGTGTWIVQVPRNTPVTVRVEVFNWGDGNASLDVRGVSLIVRPLMRQGDLPTLS